MPSRETDDVFKILVSELAYTLMPTSVMGLTLATIGLTAYSHLGSMLILCGVIVGGAASLARVLLIQTHRRAIAIRPATMEESVAWERKHGLLTFIVAGSVSWLASLMFLHRDLSVHVLAGVLIFGYCAGISSRVSIRPYLAVTALTIAGVPPVLCMALNGDKVHLILAVVSAVFLVAAMQTVWHMYRISLREICQRLDMHRQARRDPLTGLCNRVALTEAFQALNREDGSLTCVHCFDLDGFKTINDRFGHAVGDELLAAIGVRLQELQSPDNIPVRIGGDEFVMLQSAVTHPDETDALAARILNALNMPYVISGKPITIGISLGYTVAPSTTADLGSMMRLADAASYRVKRQGGGIDREAPLAPDATAVSSAA